MLTTWLLLALLVLVIVVVLIYVLAGYKPYTAPTLTPTQMADIYTPTNPWGWDAKQSSVPVEGPDGQCNVYTFSARGQFEPGVSAFTNIRSCTTGCTGASNCNCSAPAVGQTCVDDDQLFAQKRQHICQETNNSWTIRTNGYCRQQDGTLVPPGTLEQFYTPCVPTARPSGQTTTEQNSNRCPGSLGLIVFNANINQTGPAAFNGAQCLQEPTYTVTTDEKGQPAYGNLSPLTTSTCNLQSTYRGYPRELFRVQRANYINGTFFAASNGSFARIIHRPTGLAVAPTLGRDNFGRLTLQAPVPGAALQLVSPTIGQEGYWWLLVPYLSHRQLSPTNQPEVLIGRPQILFVNNPAQVPNLNDQQATWTYVTAPNRYVMGPTSYFVTQPPSAVILRPYVTTNQFSDDQVLSRLNATQFMEYAIMGLIASQPKNFDFNGPFPPGVTT